jgi:hypothetical protein
MRWRQSHAAATAFAPLSAAAPVRLPARSAGVRVARAGRLGEQGQKYATETSQAPHKRSTITDLPTLSLSG